MDTELMFSSKSVEWETPRDLFDKLDKEFHFTLDVCATDENAKCTEYYTKEQNGLDRPWTGVCWCNPPYGRKVYLWIKKAAQAALEGNTVVMLLPSRTDTRWFHKYLYQQPGVELRFLPGRLKFVGSQNTAPFPSLVAVFRPAGEEMTFGDIIINLGEQALDREQSIPPDDPDSILSKDAQVLRKTIQILQAQKTVFDLMGV